MMVKWFPALAFVGTLVSACAQTPPPTTMPVPLTLETAVQAALADASRRSGLAIEALQVLGASSVTWRDGSLGCPQPDRAYTQALVPGYRIRVRAAGQEFDYHAGLRGAVSWCPPGRAVEPLPDDGRR
jgi:hypothetical protein